ncbi:MAG: hypothetical protein U0M72_06760 [Eggerthellaceae bacterium]
MRNRTIVGVAGALVSLAAVLLVVVFLGNVQQGTEAEQDASYKDSHTYHFAIGETANLDSAQDDEGSACFWQAAFCWEGTFAVTLKDVSAYRDSESGFNGLADSNALSHISDEPSPVALVVATLELENIDAKPVMENWFIASIFELRQSVSGDYPYVDLGDAALNSTEKDLLKFFIGPGNKEQIKLGWFVHEADLSNDMKLVVGSTGSEKYIFDIPATSIQER